MENIQIPELVLFLAKPDKTTIGKLKHISDKKLSIKSDEVSEISFTLPYYISVNNEQVRNPHVDKIKEKYLIRSEFRGKTEWFIIDSISRSSSDTDNLDIQCFSLEYQLKGQLVIDYEEVSRNCKEATEDVLKGTDWTVGYINPTFNTKYRHFDISQGTKLSTIYEIGETFESVVTFDTVKKTVNHYTKEELSHYKGFNIGYGKYIQNIDEKIDADEIVTRLYVYGSDGLQINSVNPTGQPYIDDFSYFLYPFEMDKNGNVTSHSEYMSDSLAKALVKYNEFVTDKKDDFGNYLSEKTELQKKLTEEQNTLVELEVDLTIILDAIIIAKDNGESTSKLNTEKKNKNKEIKSAKNAINKLEQQIADIESKIQTLGEELNMETHLTAEQLNELSNFIQEEEWTDDNQFDVNDLYEAGWNQMEEINSPPINISTSIVNFMRMIDEKHNWERFDVGDIIKVEHERLGIDIKTTLSAIDYDFESDSIGVVISNTEKELTTEDIIAKSHYKVGKVDTELSKRKIDWNKTAYNFNIRNDRIDKKPTDPTNATIKHKSNNDGSVNLILKWDYPDYSETKKKADNIDGFIIYMYSSGTDEPYQFTSKMSEETLIPNVSQDKRAHTIPSVPADLFYTIGIRAYRRVDEDINRDGILMSEIVGFNQSSSAKQRMRSAMVHTVAMSDEDNPYKSYQPDYEVNISGRINGAKFSPSYTQPSNPVTNDIWIDLENHKLWIWNGKEWSGDIELEDIKDQIEDNRNEINDVENKFKEDLEESRAKLEEALKAVEEGMEHIQNEVIPEVERAIEETTIPEGEFAPEEVPLSGMWMDTSQQPPRMMKWDEETGEWVPLAPSEEDITDLIKKEQESIKIEQQRYARFEVTKARDKINKQIEKEIGNVNEQIKELEDMAEDLKTRVEETEQYVEDLKATIGDDIKNIGEIANEMRDLAENLQKELGEFEGRIVSVEQIVDEVNGHIGTFITDIERIDGEVTKNTSSIEQQAKLISQKVDSIQYSEDKEGIIQSIDKNSSAIEQMDTQIKASVSREEFETATADYEERISSAETSITAHSEAIEQKAEKSELINYVDKTEYTNKVGSLETSINGITGRVEKTEGTLDNITGELESVSEQYAELSIKADGIASEVSRVEEDLDGKIESTNSLVRQNADAIEQKVSSLDYNKDKTGILSSIEANTSSISQLTDEINLRVTKEEVEDFVNGLDFSNRNLFIPNDNVEFRKSTDITKVAPYSFYAESRWLGFSEPISIKGGETITVSFWAKSETEETDTLLTQRVGFIGDPEDNDRTSNHSRNVEVTTEWQYYENTFTVADLTEYIRFYARSDTEDNKVWINGLMIVRGNKAPIDYSPAPEETESRITKAEADIILNSEAIALKAEKSELTNYVDIQSYTNQMGELDVTINNITSRVSSAETTINKNTGDIESARSRIAEIDTTVEGITSTVSDLNSDLTTANQSITRIEQKADGVITTVGKIETDISGLEGDMTAIQTTIEQLPDEIELKVSEGIQGLGIGGSNRLLGSSNEYRDLNVTMWHGTIKTNRHFEEYGFEHGDTATFSVDIKAINKPLRARVDFYSGLTGEEGKRSFTANKTIDIGTEGRSSVTVTLDEETPYIRLMIVNADSTNYTEVTTEQYKAEQLEKGSIATDWSPAPEDLANKNNIISSINLSTEGIKIQAPKLDITGIVNFINTDGTTGTLINGNKLITGSVTAEQLNVDEIFANSAIISKIQSDIVKTTKLDASQIVTGELDAGKISVKGLSAQDIVFTGQMFGEGATFAGRLEGVEIFGSSIEGGVFRSGYKEDGYSGYVYIEGTRLEINDTDDTGRLRDILFDPKGIKCIDYVPYDRVGSFVFDIEKAAFTHGITVGFDTEGGTNSGVYLPLGHRMFTGLTSGSFMLEANKNVADENAFTFRTHQDNTNYVRVFEIRSNDGTFVSMPTRNNEVTWSGRAAVANNTGRFGYVSSSKRFKLAIDDIKSDPYNVLKIKPRSWFDKNNTEKYAELLTKRYNGENVNIDDIDDDIKRIPGLIAEEVEEAGLPEFVTYRDGKIDGVQYDRFPILFIPILKDHETKLSTHEQEINDLKRQIQLKDSQILQLKQRIERVEDLVG